VPSENGVNTITSLESAPQANSTRHCVLWCPKEWKGQSAIFSWLPGIESTVCYNDVCTRGSKCLRAVESMLLLDTGKDGRPHPQKKKHGACTKNDYNKL
jgi:hypothetical protein